MKETKWLRFHGETKEEAQKKITEQEGELIALYNPILAAFLSDYQVGTATFDNPYLDLSKAMNLSQIDAWKVSKGAILYLRFAVKKERNSVFSLEWLSLQNQKEKNPVFQE